jgi:hypothetical protein
MMSTYCLTHERLGGCFGSGEAPTGASDDEEPDSGGGSAEAFAEAPAEAPAEV